MRKRSRFQATMWLGASALVDTVRWSSSHWMWGSVRNGAPFAYPLCSDDEDRIPSPPQVQHLV